MAHDNYGSQSGNHSINVGVGDFRSAHVHVSTGDGRTPIHPEQMAIRRHIVFGRRLAPREELGTFSLITGLASLAGVYFTLFQPFPSAKYSSWTMLFLFSLGIATTCFLISVVLKKHRFSHFLFRQLYLELGSRDGVFVTKLTATCPWCNAKMNLRNVGPKNGPRDDWFVCERNPSQHTVDLDPTALEEIVEQPQDASRLIQ